MRYLRQMSEPRNNKFLFRGDNFNQCALEELSALHKSFYNKKIKLNLSSAVHLSSNSSKRMTNIPANSISGVDGWLLLETYILSF